MKRQSAGEPTELELKFQIEAGDLEALRSSAILVSRLTQPARTRRLVTTYYDDRDGSLAARGISLRVRKADGQRVQTVKQRQDDHGSGMAAAVRREWEWPIRSDRPDLAVLADCGLADLVPASGTDAFVPVYTTDVERREMDLDLGNGCLVELVLDHGQVTAGKASQPLSELEIELKAGPVAPLYRLALDLLAEFPLRIGVESKAQLGRALATGAGPAAVKVSPAHIDPSMTLAAGIHRIVSGLTGNVLANQAAVLDGDRIEGVHQMRVALRQLRTALLVFETVTHRPGNRRFSRRFQEIARQLGDCRDWDVFVTEILPRLRRKTAKAATPGTLEIAAAAGEGAARALVADMLRSAEYTRLVLEFSLWIESGAWRRGLAPRTLRSLDRPLAECLPVLLDPLTRRVQKRGRRLKQQSPDALHALRKDTKRLRYGVAFFASLPSDPRKQSSYLDALRTLQSVLGEINDARVADNLLGMLGGMPGLAQDAKALAARAEAILDKRRAALPDAWKKFKKTTPYWR
jgi:inorganic triphosphatase YgiF